MGSKITIELPDSDEERQEVMLFLKNKGVHVEGSPIRKEARASSDTGAKKKRLLHRYKTEPRLTGHGEELAKLRKAFRADLDS